jgi:septum formation protein
MSSANQKFYLASKSPRRRELLQQIGADFELLLLRDKGPRGPDVIENVLLNENPQDYVQRVTAKKAEFAHRIMLARNLPRHAILSADTTVVIDDCILGKPLDATQAAAMLGALSGRSHQVLTCVIVQHNQQIWQVTQSSEVTFSKLSEQAINAYCETAEPYDKAGAYGIQGYAARFIQHISGSYTGIMGLPLFETAQLLEQAGILSV